MALYFITGNKNKVAEAIKIIPDIEHCAIDLIEIQEIDAQKIIKAKLLEGLRNKQGEIMVEDTSLYLDCLNNLPGPLIKWFLNTVGDKGLFTIAEKLGNTNATAKTVIGYAKTPEEIHYFEGSIKGNIVEPRGVSSFGWDAIFLPEGMTKTFSELTREEKNTLSMRSKALNKLREFRETAHQRIG